MGFDGGHRAGYKQVVGAVDSTIVTDTMGAVTGDWCQLEVLSSEIQLVGITAPGCAGSSFIDSDTTFDQGWKFACSQITIVQVSAKCTDGRLLCHDRVLL